MKNIDWAQGLIAGQDHSAGQRGIKDWQRSCLWMWRINGREDGSGEEGHWVPDPETQGDVIGWVTWNRDTRDVNAWAQVFPAMRVQAESSSGGDGPKGEVPPESREPTGPITPSSPGRNIDLATGQPIGTGGGGGMGSEGSGSPTFSAVAQDVLPIKSDQWVQATEFKAVTPTRPAGAGGNASAWPRFPGGHVGLVVSSVDTDAEHKEFHPTDPRLIAVNRAGDPGMGTFVCDLTSGSNYSAQRRAPLQSMMRVVMRPRGKFTFSGNRTNVIAWNIGRSGQRDAIGGLVADGGGGASRYGAVSVRNGGPWDTSPGCKHRVGTTGDGEPISAMHLSSLAFHRRSNRRDGPKEFNEDYPNPGDLLYPIKVQLGWDALQRYTWPRDGGGEQATGVWRRWTTSNVKPPWTPTVPDAPTTPGTPTTPRDPPRQGDPPGGPTTPGSPNKQPSIGQPVGAVLNIETIAEGNSAQTNMRQVLATHIDTGFTSMFFRAQRWENGLIDIGHSFQPGADAVNEFDRTSPNVARFVPYGAQRGTVGGPHLDVGSASSATRFNYTQEPGNSRSFGGTAQGGLVFMPPELDMTDVDKEFSPTWTDVSSTAMVFVPGTRVVFGLPELAGGGTRDGYALEADAGDLKVTQIDATGAETLALTMDTAGDAAFTGDVSVTGALSGGTVLATSTETYTLANDSTDRNFDADTVTLPELADVVSTLLRDLAAGKSPTIA